MSTSNPVQDGNWVAFNDGWPDDGQPVVFRNVHTAHREWRPARLTDFPRIVEDPSVPDFPELL